MLSSEHLHTINDNVAVGISSLTVHTIINILHYPGDNFHSYNYKCIASFQDASKVQQAT